MLRCRCHAVAGSWHADLLPEAIHDLLVTATGMQRLQAGIELAGQHRALRMLTGEGQQEGINTNHAQPLHPLAGWAVLLQVQHAGQGIHQDVVCLFVQQQVDQLRFGTGGDFADARVVDQFAGVGIALGNAEGAPLQGLLGDLAGRGRNQAKDANLFVEQRRAWPQKLFAVAFGNRNIETGCGFPRDGQFLALPQR